jgi:plastocyanin
MKCSSGVFGAGLVLAMVVSGCGRGAPEQPTTEIPPAPPAADQPATSTANGYEVTTVADGGIIGGTITVSGAIPQLPPRQPSKDPQVCGTAPRPSEKLVVSRSGGLKNAVVMVEGIKRGKAIPAAVQNALLDQKNCEYLPHVQVMALNSEIKLKNSDPILHNVQFFQDDNSLFNIAQPVQGQENNRKMEKAGVVYVECAVHGWMQGNVVIVDNPYYAVTDNNGKFSIPDLPPGNYRVKIWHEYLGETTRDITVTGKTETALNMDLKDLLAKKLPSAITAAPGTPGQPGTAAVPGVAPAPGDAKAPAGNEVVVQMHEETGSGGTTFRFAPADITVKVGTTVKWVNVTEPRHTSTADPEWETPQARALLPPGAMPWRSKFLTEGQSTTHTFTVPGKYQYFCETHGMYGMKGTVTVTP